MSDYQEEVPFDCPYCAEPNSVMIDLTAGREQTFTTDCEICCHPIVINVTVTEDGISEFDVERESV